MGPLSPTPACLPLLQAGLLNQEEGEQQTANVFKTLCPGEQLDCKLFPTEVLIVYPTTQIPVVGTGGQKPLCGAKTLCVGLPTRRPSWTVFSREAQLSLLDAVRVSFDGFLSICCLPFVLVLESLTAGEMLCSALNCQSGILAGWLTWLFFFLATPLNIFFLFEFQSTITIDHFLDRTLAGPGVSSL